MNVSMPLNIKVFILLSAASLTLGVGTALPFGRTVPQTLSSQQTLSTHALACGEQTSMSMAVVGRIAHGHSAAELIRKGYGVVPALVSTQQLSTATNPALEASPATDNTVVIYSHTVGPSSSGTSLLDHMALLQNEPALQSVGVLHAQSSDAALRSCDYRLSDSPAAQALRQTATFAMLAHRYLTQAQLDDPLTIFLISDDPLQAGRKFVTVVLAHPMTAAEVASPPVSRNPPPVVVSVEWPTMKVLAVGYGNWYAGQ